MVINLLFNGVDGPGLFRITCFARVRENFWDGRVAIRLEPVEELCNCFAAGLGSFCRSVVRQPSRPGAANGFLSWTVCILSLSFKGESSIGLISRSMYGHTAARIFTQNIGTESTVPVIVDGSNSFVRLEDDVAMFIED